ncbi:hypothetical protein F5Y15DRAFT_414365 [Xylariaceae sp. FL0016]|nr:hypothetical protein F5Y15DRAFT_414365 [Xylariaceae sp. FL0016]
MKWATTFLSLGLAATSAWAAPVQGDLDLYQLKISAPTNKELDGRYLALNGSDLGLYEGDDTSPVQVYHTDSDKKGCVEMHTYPVGFVDHSLALSGPPGLLTFVDMISPEGRDPGEGRVTKYDTFRIDDGKVTNDEKGKWLAFPDYANSWKVKWSDGSSPTTTDYMPVEVIYESAGEGSYNGV